MIDAEQGLIRWAVGTSECLADCDFVQPDDFGLSRHREIWAAAQDMHANGDTVDVITLGTRTGHFDYLVELSQIEPAAHWKTLGELVQREGYRRKVLSLIDETRSELISSPSVDEMASALADMPDKIKSPETDYRAFKDMCRDTIDRLDRRMKSEEPEGIKTGFASIDDRLGGIKPADFVVIAGRPSMGKTAYAMNIAERMALNGLRGLVFSLEMSEAQLMDRMLSSLSGVQAYRLQRGKLIDGDLEGVSAAGYKLKKMDLCIIDRPALKIGHLAGIARKFHRKSPLDFIVIDYLQLIRADTKDRFQEISEISRLLKALAKQLNIPVIALSQLSRSVESRTSKRPMMSDLRESGQIEQDADIIQMLYRDEYYNPDSDLKGYCEVITCKFRNGETGSDFLQSELDRCRFIDAEHVPQYKEEPVYVYKK